MNLERGGRLERVKPIFSPVRLCRAWSWSFCLRPEAPERKAGDPSPGEKGEIPKEVNPKRVAVFRDRVMLSGR
jgi:hypothetical protein